MTDLRLIYRNEDDILVIHFSDKPVAKEVSQDWNTHVSYTEDGSVAKITVVDARISGVVPARYLPDTDTLYIEFQKSEVADIPQSSFGQIAARYRCSWLLPKPSRKNLAGCHEKVGVT